MAVSKSTGTGEANIIGTRGATPAPPPADEAAVPEVTPDTGKGSQVCTLTGVGEPAQVSVGLPLPIDLVYGGAMYTLSDRAAGVYTFRH